MQTTEASEFLRTLDTDWHILIDTVGACTIATTAHLEPYEALVQAISRQQIHGKAADAIMQRFLELFPSTDRFPTPDAVLTLSTEQLRSVGFSTNKTLAIQGIATAAQAGNIPSRQQAESMTNEELIQALIPLRGVGRWTVEMLLMFTLERIDVLPVDDFGVREGYRKLKKLATAPTPKTLRTLGEAWQPYRSVAAWYLWQAARFPEPIAPTTSPL